MQKKHILIPGYPEKTINYKNAVIAAGAVPTITLSPISIEPFHMLILPGGGDIDPSFFNQKNTASRQVDKFLDQIQFYYLHQFVQSKKPIIGICKGMQLINVYFGGNIIQDMTASQNNTHSYQEHDMLHDILKNSGFPNELCSNFDFLHSITTVNSAHHQCIGHLGEHLTILHYANDSVPETIVHTSLPIIGFQWHPERLFNNSQVSTKSFLTSFLENYF